MPGRPLRAAALAAVLLTAGCGGAAAGSGSYAGGAGPSGRPGAGSGPPGLPTELPTGLPGLPTGSPGAAASSDPGSGDGALCAQVLTQVGGLTTEVQDKPPATAARLYGDAGRRVGALAGTAENAALRQAMQRLSTALSTAGTEIGAGRTPNLNDLVQAAAGVTTVCSAVGG
jgi:hypothetical protein